MSCIIGPPWFRPCSGRSSTQLPRPRAPTSPTSFDVSKDPIWAEWQDSVQLMQNTVREQLARQELLLVRALVQAGQSPSSPKGNGEDDRDRCPTKGSHESLDTSTEPCYGEEENRPVYQRSGSNTNILERLQSSYHAAPDHKPSTSFMVAVPGWVYSLLDWWSDLQEPRRKGCLHDILYSRVCQIGIAVLIFLNLLFATHQANGEMESLEKTKTNLFFECVFIFFFAFEICVKLIIHRLYFFVNQDASWNVFDLLVVGLTALDLTVSTSEEQFSVGFARTLRLFKLTRILKLLKALRFLRDLRIMMSTLTGSLVTLFWSIIMLTLICYMFALFFIQQFINQSEELRNDPELWTEQRKYFRNVQTAALSLAMSCMGGIDWIETYKLVATLGPLCTIVFLFYIVFFNFAVVNIVTGVFVESAIKLSKTDRDDLILEERHREVREMDDLMAVIKAMDHNRSGTLSMEEFTSGVREPRARAALAALGMDIKNAELFFWTLASVTGVESVKIEDFCRHAMRMKGVASSIDLHGLIFRTMVVQETLSDYHAEQMEVMRDLATTVRNPTRIVSGAMRLKRRKNANMGMSFAPAEDISQCSRSVTNESGMVNRMQARTDASSETSLEARNVLSRSVKGKAGRE